ncbi:hypothetical protein AVEN_229031-1 [Araneus ventricosus]|uniref:Uncharacterized protein n=1 Tax=Araneus ventricosus TaxID=182803 RepID=A0A4Y2CX25_ARAVE|nr:hypothetical protein AVEN_229031-1 [Araneus ventricosus]
MFLSPHPWPTGMPHPTPSTFLTSQMNYPNMISTAVTFRDWLQSSSNSRMFSYNLQKFVQQAELELIRLQWSYYGDLGRCGLVVRSRLWGQKVPGSKPDSTEDPCVLGLFHVKSYVGGQMSSRWCGVEVWRGGASSDVVLVI